MKKLLLLLLLLGAATAGHAQYYFLRFPAAGQNPGGLNKEDEYPPGGGLAAGWTTILTGPKATPSWTANQKIPFTFTFNGKNFDYYKVASTGVLTFDTSAVTAPSVNNVALPSAEIPNNSACIWGINAVAASDFIVTKTFGTAPNRQHWVFFNSYGEAGVKTGWTYWSIVLEESSNKIYFVDQRTQCVENGNACTAALTVTVGLQFDATTAVQLPESPNVNTTVDNTATVANNTFYEFAPGSQPDYDVQGLAITGKRYFRLSGGDIGFTGTVRNLGAKAVNSMVLAYTVNGGTPVRDTITGLNVATGSNYNFTHNKKWKPVTGDHQIKIWAAEINFQPDANKLNDTMAKLITVVDTSYKRKVLHESFTSSTCPPCLPGNNKLNSVINQRPSDYVNMKYQYYFPSTGDPYYTLEGRARGTYYGNVNAIPELKVDGTFGINPNGYDLSILDNISDVPAFFSLQPTASIKDNRTVNAEVTITTLRDYPAGLKLYMAVCEKRTTKNVKTNGETEFFHVFKKFINGPQGLKLPAITKGQPQTFSGSYTFKGNYRLPLDAQAANIIVDSIENSVENFGNLEIVAFVQDSATREVFQAERVDITGFTATQEFALNDNITVYPNPANQGFWIRFDELDLNQTTTLQVLDLTGKQVYNGVIDRTDAFVSASGWAPGMYLLHVRSGKDQAVGKILIQR